MSPRRWLLSEAGVVAATDAGGAAARAAGTDAVVVAVAANAADPEGVEARREVLVGVSRTRLAAGSRPTPAQRVPRLAVGRLKAVLSRRAAGGLGLPAAAADRGASRAAGRLAMAAAQRA